MNSFRQHFGIGSETTIDSLVVKWPSGTVDELLNPNINAQITLSEGSNPVVLLGDCNLDGNVNFLDISLFINVLSTQDFLAQADCNQDGGVNFLDISPFIGFLSSSN